MCPDCGREHEVELLCSKYVVSCEGTEGALEARQLPPAPSPVGQNLGSFRVERQIGEGAMGTVFLARHAVIGSAVAAKVLRPRLAEHPRLVERFYAEARAVSMVGHENIVKVFDMGVSESGLHYMLMELLEGETLSQLPVPAPPSVAIPILTQVCDALEAAHRVGVVHMDIKPGNVILVRRRRSFAVKVLDFGAARLLSEAAGGTLEGMVVGTPAYMPPEQWRKEAADGRSDVYGLGVTAYWLATGRLPFFAGSVREMFLAHRDLIPRPPHEVSPRVGREWSDAIMRALAKRKEDRFASAAELGAALRRILRRRRVSPLTPSGPLPSYVSSTTSFDRHAPTSQILTCGTAGPLPLTFGPTQTATCLPSDPSLAGCASCSMPFTSVAPAKAA